MKEKTFGNYLRAHRKQAGLSQKELGRLLGYKRSWQVSRHEISETAPPLMIALGYQEIFKVPLTAIFTGMHKTVVELVEGNLAELEKDLQNQDAKGRQSNDTAQKLQWFKHRKTLMSPRTVGS